jgi:hypothetical protein
MYSNAPVTTNPPQEKPSSHDVPEILVRDRVDDVGDVRGQADLGAGQVHALTDAGKAGREHLVAPDRPHSSRDPLVHPVNTMVWRRG